MTEQHDRLHQTDVVSHNEEEDALQYRRSNRKRRRINYYKPSDRKQKVNKLPAYSKKRRQPKIQTVIKRNEETTQNLENSAVVSTLDDVDRVIKLLIESEDKDRIQGVINRLIKCLHMIPSTSTLTSTTDYMSEDAAGSSKVLMSDRTKVFQNSSVVEDDGDALRTTMRDNSCLLKTTPANLQTKSVSVHGNSVIIDGVINTGLAQTSCYLIPIDINNIHGRVQILGGSAMQPLQGTDHHKGDNNMTTSNRISGVAPQLYGIPPSNIFGIAPPKVLVGTGAGVQYSSTHVGGSNAPMLIPINRFTQYSPAISMSQSSPTFMGPAAAGTVAVSTPTPSLEEIVTEPYEPPTTSRDPVPKLDEPLILSSDSSKPTNQHVPVIHLDDPDTESNGHVAVADSEGHERHYEGVTISTVTEITKHNTSTKQESTGKAGKEHDPSGRPVDSDVAIDYLIDALQSTESLTKILDQLSYDEMLAIVDILATPTANTDDSATSSFLVSNSSNETSSQTLEGLIPHDDDEDFRHVQIEQQSEGTDSETNITCVLCGKVCPDNKNFVNHMRYHLFNHRYSCYECGFGTSSMNELLLHKSNNHEGDLNKISPEFLQRLPKRERVISTEEEDNTPILCPECNIEIPLHALGRHMGQAHKPMNKITPGRKPKCSVCTARVDNKVEVAAHLAHHGPDNHAFVCYFCPSSFASVSLLQLHTTDKHAVLATKRLYKCTHCYREFSGSYHLIRHVKTVHEQRRDYKCSKCDKSFVELHCLRRHIRNIHSLIRDHTCPVCHRGFTYRQDMFRHIMSVHQKIRDIKCPLCGDKFYHRYFIGHATRVHDLRVKYRDGICYIYDDSGNVIHKIT